jgi:hypothetical protein
MFDWIKAGYSACISYITLWYSSTANAFFGKTELELNGIGVIKDSAEILANSITSFPSKATVIALIGLIIVSQGVYLFSKGTVNIMCSRNDQLLRTRGYAQCLVGLCFLLWGFMASLYCTDLAKLLFS